MTKLAWLATDVMAGYGTDAPANMAQALPLEKFDMRMLDVADRLCWDEKFGGDVEVCLMYLMEVEQRRPGTLEYQMQLEERFPRWHPSHTYCRVIETDENDFPTSWYWL